MLYLTFNFTLPHCRILQ